MNKVFFIVPILIFIINTECCTGILLKTTKNSPVYARTLEFGTNLESHILVVPRNYVYQAPAPHNKHGLQWKTRYAVLGANAFKSLYFVDGVNEKGLAGGLYYFPGYAEYQDVEAENFKKSLPFWCVLTWILTNFETIEEVKKQLPQRSISKTEFPDMHQDPPAHIIIHDLSGKSIVIEYIKGVLHIHDNPLGVITNSPTFDWHLTNIKNYINLSPMNIKSKKLSSLELSPLGQGSGMLGLPGDFTPPSRFIRAVYFSQSAPKLATEQEAIDHAFHILNNFDIPKGAIQDKGGMTDYTTWTSAIDMKNKIFYYKTYDNQTVKKVALAPMTEKKSIIQLLPMNN